MQYLVTIVRLGDSNVVYQGEGRTVQFAFIRAKNAAKAANMNIDSGTCVIQRRNEYSKAPDRWRYFKTCEFCAGDELEPVSERKSRWSNYQ